MAEPNAVQRLIEDVRAATPGLRYQDIADRSGLRPDGRTVLIRTVVQKWADQQTWERSPSREAREGLARGLGVPISVVDAAFARVLDLCDHGPFDHLPSLDVMEDVASRLGVLGATSAADVFAAFAGAFGGRGVECGHAGRPATAAHALADRVDALSAEDRARVLWAAERMTAACEAREAGPPPPGSTAADLLCWIQGMPEDDRQAAWRRVQGQGDGVPGQQPLPPGA